MCVIISPTERQVYKIVNDREKLIEFHEAHKNDIWIGYNNRQYDQYIHKGIICGFDPKKINDHIIVEKKPAWTFSRQLSQIHMINYDCMTSFHGLKTLEGFMGNDIRETSVPFDIDRKLTNQEIEEVLKYCQHDVEQTVEVWLQNQSDFNAQLALIKLYELPLSAMGKTKARLAPMILNASPVKLEDEWEIRVPETLELSKYKYIADWFLNPVNHSDDKSLEIDVCGVPHVFAWGGVHGAITKYNHICSPDELLIMADVDQLYPTIMLEYGLLSRAIPPDGVEKFKDILATSLRLKAEGRKSERAPYKLICNIVYGAEGDKTNDMFDPLHRKLVCVFGQLLMLMLLEMLEDRVPSFELVQSNTDGILIKIKQDDFDLVDDVVYEWEQKTRLHMSFDQYKAIYQGDVNNYVAVEWNGKVKSKGAYVKSLNPLDYDLPIVNKAILKRLTEGVPPEKTINECDDLIEYQKIVKVSNKYFCGYHNGQDLTDKTFRVFASTDPLDSYIGKKKNKDACAEKFANTPIHCFIMNESVKGVKVDARLDKQYYIDLAYKRLREKFGVW